MRIVRIVNKLPRNEKSRWAWNPKMIEILGTLHINPTKAYDGITIPRICEMGVWYVHSDLYSEISYEKEFEEI